MNLVDNSSNWTNSTDKDAIGTPDLKTEVQKKTGTILPKRRESKKQKSFKKRNLAEK